jgi:hypothetical protein
MAISIIVEDGSVVESANSYITVAEARIYASNRGVTLPTTDDSVAAMLIQATDYLQARECKYQGERVSASQVLSFPRSDVVIFGIPLASDAIPGCLKAAQVQLAMAVNAGFELLPNVTANSYVTKEKVGVIETEYSDPLQVGMSPSFGAVESLLAPLFGECSNGFALRTIRV